jgi:hypothetical protein
MTLSTLCREETAKSLPGLDVSRTSREYQMSFSNMKWHNGTREACFGMGLKRKCEDSLGMFLGFKKVFFSTECLSFL